MVNICVMGPNSMWLQDWCTAEDMLHRTKERHTLHTLQPTLALHVHYYVLHT